MEGIAVQDVACRSVAAGLAGLWDAWEFHAIGNTWRPAGERYGDTDKWIPECYGVCGE